MKITYLNIIDGEEIYSKYGPGDVLWFESMHRPFVITHTGFGAFSSRSYFGRPLESTEDMYDMKLDEIIELASIAVLDTTGNAFIKVVRKKDYHKDYKFE